MKYSLLIAILLTLSSALMAESADQQKEPVNSKTEGTKGAQNVTVVYPLVEVAQENESTKKEPVELSAKNKTIRISVTGQGVAPMNTTSPAQAYALAKRAAVADAYRLIAEKIKGVRIDGQDLIKNMMVKRSTIRTSVEAMVRNANIVETTFKEGLCEVEMEIVLSHSLFAQ